MPIKPPRHFKLHMLPWKWMLRKSRLILIVLTVLIFSILMLFLVLYFTYYRCSDREVERVVEIICQKVISGKTFGSLCSDLCITKILKPTACEPSHLGKDVVFRATYGGTNVIVKSAHLVSSAYDRVYWTNQHGLVEYPSTRMFYDMLADTVVHNLNIKDNSSVPKNSLLVERLWQKNLSEFEKLPADVRNVAMDDVWSLVQQTEYLMLKFLDSSHLFPEILGTCGSLYIEEFLKPVDNVLSVLYPTWRDSFKKRAQIALTIIDYLEAIEQWFPGIQICDVKHNHFGIDSFGRMKLLDVDMVFYKNALIKNMLLEENCSSNEDCSFLDCKGFCDVKNNSCLPFVKDTNFQRVCVKIFLGKFAPSYLGLLGLPPKSIAQKLQSVLGSCLSEMDAEDSDILQKQIRQLLQEFLKLHTANK